MPQRSPTIRVRAENSEKTNETIRKPARTSATTAMIPKKASFNRPPRI
jgi:hypothetical protein